MSKSRIRSREKIIRGMRREWLCPNANMLNTKTKALLQKRGISQLRFYTFLVNRLRDVHLIRAFSDRKAVYDCEGYGKRKACSHSVAVAIIVEGRGHGARGGGGDDEQEAGAEDRERVEVRVKEARSRRRGKC